MKKAALLAIPIMVGLYLVYQGFNVLTTTARGVGVAIYRLGMLIPLQTSSLRLYGSSFLLAGIILIFAPILIIMMIKKKETN